MEYVMRLSYKQVFTQLYPADAAGSRPPDELFTILPNGGLSIQFGETPDIVDLGVSAPTLSTMVLSGGGTYQEVETSDGRCHLSIEAFIHQGNTEFWLIHTDHANGKFRRAKLNTEWRGQGRHAPRVALSPNGTFFVVDDSGTVRLYSTTHLSDIGAFQVAHAHTENRIVALACTPDERLIAGLSSWKDVVIYNVEERRVAFVRQIKDNLGWYDHDQAYIVIAGAAEAIITAGISQGSASQGIPNWSINVFQAIQWSPA
jgi:hypothetical protein